MLLDSVRPIDVHDVGYLKLLMRGLLVACLEALLLYIAYTDENPTSFVYFVFAGIILASKMRLRASTWFSKEEYTSPEKRNELEEALRDNKEIFKVGITGRLFYLVFALVITTIFACSMAYNKLQNDNDVYPFFQLKPEELKTKYLLIVLVMSWTVLVLDFMCGRSYHWSELCAYEKFQIGTLQRVIDAVLVYLIFSFSKQVKFSIFSLIFFFFVLLSITVFLFSLLRRTSKTVSFDRYISFLKWLTLAGMIVIYSKKSYRKFIDLFGRYISPSTSRLGGDWMKDLVDQFIDKDENFDRILLIFVLCSMRQFFADVAKMIGNLRQIIDHAPNITEDTHFVRYFGENILLIMNKRGSDIINYNGSYRLDYFQELAEVEPIRLKFEAIFAKVKIKITTMEKYYLLLKKLLQALLSIFLNLLKNHTMIIFQIILNYLIIRNTQYMVLMIMPIIWCMLSFVAFNPTFSTLISIVFLYIPTSLAILQVVASNILCNRSGVIYKLLTLEGYCSFMNRYPILSENNGDGSIQTLESEKERLFGLLTLTIFYIVLLIEKKKNASYVNLAIVKQFEGLTGLQDIKHSLYDDVVVLVKFIVSKIFSNFYYICLIFLFLGIIQTISVFNFVLIGFFFYFILNSAKAKQYWIYLLLYLQFLLVVRFLYSLKIFTFNLDRETNAMIGLYFGTGNPKDENAAMFMFWLVLIAISVQYMLFYTKLALEFRRVELKFHSAFLNKAVLYLTEIQVGLRLLYLNSIIWFFHFFLGMILIYSERTIFNVILMLMEIIFFFYHLRVSKTLNPTLGARKRVNKFWMVMAITILLFAFLFYIFLFCKFTVTKRYLSKMLGIDEDKQPSYAKFLLNEKIANEFTMLYLLQQKNLQIEENSFIRENLKILLAFVCFFKIVHERAFLKREEARAESGPEGTELQLSNDEGLERRLSEHDMNFDLNAESHVNGMPDLRYSDLDSGRTTKAKSQFLTATKTRYSEEHKLAFSLKDLWRLYERLLVYLSHLWKSAILMHIIYWNMQGPNIFKIIILFTILLTFYRYLKAATTLMDKSRLSEILDKKLKYYSDCFVKKFEYEPVYPGLDMDQASDHYVVVNKNFYYALRNQFSMINTQISKLLYFLVFHFSWLYFVYIYIRQIFSPNLSGGSATNGVMNLLFNTTSTQSDIDQNVNYTREQFTAFLLITFLVIENKIIERVTMILSKNEESSPNEGNIEKCAEGLLAHLDLYIMKRNTMDQSQKANQNTLRKMATTVGGPTGSGQNGPSPGTSPTDANSAASEMALANLQDALQDKIALSYKDNKFMDMLAVEESKRYVNNDIFNRIANHESIDDLPNDHSIRLCLNESTSYIQKLIFFNSVKSKYSSTQMLYAFMHQMQRIALVFLMAVITLSPSIPNIACCALIFYLEMKDKTFSQKISIFCLIACALILKDDTLMMLQKINWLGFFDLTKKYSDPKSVWKFILNFDIRVIYLATIFLFFSNLFILITIAISKSIIMGVNSHRFLKSNIFWFFQAGKAKKGKKSTRIVVDHKMWMSSEGGIVLALRNLVFIYPLELYVMVMTTIAIVVTQQAITIVMICTAFPYILTFFDIKSNLLKAKLERAYFNIFIIVCWLLLIILYPMIVIFGNSIETWDNLKLDLALPLVILINRTYKEFMSEEDYIDNQTKLTKNKLLLSSLTNYCYTYEYNERKLRENLNIFMKQQHVIECTERIDVMTESTGNESAEVVEDMFKYDDSILEIVHQKSTKWEEYKILFFTYLYKFLLDLNYKEIFESVFYLYSNFKRKNRKIITECDLNLNQFLKLETDVMQQSIVQVELFYQKLREKDTEKVGRFDEVFEKIEESVREMEINDRIQSEKNQKTNGEDGAGQNKYREADAGGPPQGEKRSEINHGEAAECIFQYVNQPIKMKRNDTDNFIFNLKKGEDLVFTNIQPYFVEQTDYFTRFDYMVVFKLFLGIFMSNLDMLIIIIMTIVHLWAGGVYAIIIYTIVFFILIEERPGQFQLWWVIAGIYFLVILAQMLIIQDKTYVQVSPNSPKHNLPSEVQAQVVLLAIGKLSSLYGVCIIFFMIILLRINFERLGFYNKHILSVENLPMAVHRVVINEDFYDIFDNEIEKEKLRIENIETKVLQKYVYVEKKPLTWNYILKLEKERIKADTVTLKRRDMYIKSAFKVIQMLRKDMFRIYTEVTDSFYWRNFSKYSFKPGKNYQGMIFTTLGIIIVLFIIFYPSLLNTTKDFTEIFFDNYVRTDFLLIFIVYTLVLALERYFSCLVNPDVLLGSFRSLERIERMLEKGVAEKTKNQTPIERFHKLIWRVKLIIRIKKVRRGEGLVSPTRNPLTKKLILTLCLWVFVCTFVYFGFPIIGNRDTRVTGLRKVLCNDYYEDTELNIGTNRCHTLWKNNWIYSMFFLLNMLYVYFSALQIRHGFNQTRETIIDTDWRSWVGYAKFKLYEALPLLREVNATIEFSAANTSLTYLEWLKMEDIRGAMLQAKYQAERRVEKVVGDAINGLVKILIGFTALVIVVLIIVSPLLLFSDLNPSHQADTVQRGKMDVDLIFDKMGNFSLLSDLHMVASKEGVNNKQKLEFSNIMESSMPFTPESIKNLENLLSRANKASTTAGTKLSVFLRINLYIKTEQQEKLVFYTNYDPANLNREYDLGLREGIMTALSESLSKRCESNGLVTQIFLGSIPSELSIKDDKITFIEKNNKFPIILSIRCSEDGRKYISAAKNKNALVIDDCRHENATKLLKKIPKLNSTSIFGLYIFIFITIGKGFIQPFLFGKAIHIWIRKSPNSLMVLLILEGMEAARASSNLFREKALFYKLIDLIRSPKSLVTLTGSMLESKKMELKTRLTREKK